MRVPRGPIALALALATLPLALRSAAADDAPPKAPKGDEPAPKAAKVEEIDWRPQWTEAVEEAAERNVLLFLHSHGST